MINTKEKKETVERSNADLALITKTLRLPYYVIEAVRLESFKKSTELGKRVTEQKIIELALKNYLNLS